MCFYLAYILSVLDLYPKSCFSGEGSFFKKEENHMLYEHESAETLEEAREKIHTLGGFPYLLVPWGTLDGEKGVFLVRDTGELEEFFPKALERARFQARVHILSRKGWEKAFEHIPSGPF